MRGVLALLWVLVVLAGLVGAVLSLPGQSFADRLGLAVLPTVLYLLWSAGFLWGRKRRESVRLVLARLRGVEYD